MEELEKEIYLIVARAEAEGGVGNSATANKILKAAKTFLSSNPSYKDKVIEKIEALKGEPGIGFPSNYLDFL